MHFFSKSFLFTFFFIVAIFYTQSTSGQETRIKYGKTNIALNEVFQISIELENAKIETHSPFPKIKDLQKKGTERGTSTSIIAGETNIIETFTQNYYPQKEGEINIPSFVMFVNEKKVKAAAITIKVGPYDESKRTKHDEIREQLFNSQEEKKFLENQNTAFLGLSTDKEEVFVEEGFTVTLALYIALTNQDDIQLKEGLATANQIAEIAKKIKPTSCWEENFNIENLEENQVMIGDKEYYQYKLYQATFFPINAEKITFPRVGLEVLEGVKNEETGKKEMKEKTFYTLTKTIKVKTLPEHPLKDKIVSGRFSLSSKIPSQQVLKTGESFRASIFIIGEGNISAIQAPNILENPEFEFYTPDVKEYISRADNKIKGVKTFTYQLIPKEAGEYNLSSYFTWIYFNPITERYDTLIPQATLKISGESLVDAEISSAHFSDFYKNINQNDNNLHQNTFEKYMRWWFRGIAIALFTFSLLIILFYKKHNKN